MAFRKRTQNELRIDCTMRALNAEFELFDATRVPARCGMRECGQVGDCPAGEGPEARESGSADPGVGVRSSSAGRQTSRGPQRRGSALPNSVHCSSRSVRFSPPPSRRLKIVGNELKDLLQRQGITEIANSKRTIFAPKKRPWRGTKRHFEDEPLVLPRATRTEHGKSLDNAAAARV